MGGGASAVASSAATFYGGGAAAGSSGSSVASRVVYMGGAGNSVGSAGVDSSQPLGQAGPVSGACYAGATAATAPSTYSATWSGRNTDSLYSMPSAGEQSWRQVNVGEAQGPSAGEIPVDESAECVLIVLCPGLLDRSWLAYFSIPGQPSRLSVLDCCRGYHRGLEALGCRFRSRMGLGRHVQQRVLT